jgi:hypothetical protein
MNCLNMGDLKPIGIDDKFLLMPEMKKAAHQEPLG